jgi:hypothetical protein
VLPDAELTFTLLRPASRADLASLFGRLVLLFTYLPDCGKVLRGFSLGRDRYTGDVGCPARSPPFDFLRGL